MLRYLSEEWMAAADEAVRAAASLGDATAGIGLVIRQTVTGAGPDGGAVTYRIVLDHGANSVQAGDGEADVSFTTDLATAAAIAGGTQSAQTAFLDGRIRLGGDVQALMAHQGVLADLDDVLGPVRARTGLPG